MKTIILLLLVFQSIGGYSQVQSERTVSDGCIACQAMMDGIPAHLSWETSIADNNELGERLTIHGIIYKNDGITPAANVILYVYHTDAKGEYSPAKGQTRGLKHGHLRGWVKTDASGRYRFHTIRPASYPQGNAPQHIHAIIKETGIVPYLIDDYVFDDDPNLTKNEREKQRKRGGTGIIKLRKDEKDGWLGERNIVLGLNVPGY